MGKSVIVDSLIAFAHLTESTPTVPLKEVRHHLGCANNAAFGRLGSNDEPMHCSLCSWPPAAARPLFVHDNNTRTCADFQVWQTSKGGCAQDAQSRSLYLTLYLT